MVDRAVVWRKVMRALNNTGMTFGDLALAFAITAGLVFGVVFFASFFYHVATMPAGEAVSRCRYGVTFRHDDHLWFRAFHSTTLHHPDCPCGGAK